MTVSIGGITLSDDLRLRGIKNQSLALMSVRRTMGGRVVIQTLRMEAGRPLVLEAFRDGNATYGYFTGSQIDQICALRDASTEVTLVHHLGTFQVIVTAVDVEDIKGVADPASTDEYSGTITLIEV